jgi:hypothetical protein
MPQVARSVYRDTGRLVGFSDAVFALTITLLVLEIRPPTDDRNLLHGLFTLWPSYCPIPGRAPTREPETSHRGARDITSSYQS